MNLEALLINTLAISIIGFACTYLAINLATKTSKKLKYLSIQTKLLIEIARKQGVDDEKIKSIVKEISG